jgi:tetratricopeptide (TPR) repeat protein
MSGGRSPQRRRTFRSLCAFTLAAWVAAPQIARAEGVAESDGSGGDEPSKAAPDSKEAKEQARIHFQKGLENYQDGDFRAALIEFERAYALQPAYRLLYNLGQVAYELRDYTGTERYFTKYLEEGKDEIPADRRAEVEQDLARVRARIASVSILTNQAGAKLFVDDREVGRAPLDGPQRLSAGQHRIQGQQTGYAPVTRVVELAGGDDVTVRLDFGARLDSAAAPAKAESSTNWPLWTGIATGVFAAGAAGFGYAAYRDSQNYEDALARETSRSELDELANGAENKAIVADVLLGAAVVTGVVTVVLLVTGGDEKPPPGRDAARFHGTPRGFGVAF